MPKQPSEVPAIRFRLPTGGEPPEEVRARLVDEVRRRLDEGELDSDLALVETALALLDGDRRLSDDPASPADAAPPGSGSGKPGTP